MRLSLALIAMFAANPALAQSALPCDGQARADNIAEPWEDNTTTFANGTIRVAVLDTVEPAGGAFYLMILHPPYDEVGLRTCTLVGLDEGLGYAYFDFANRASGYDQETGLVIEIPATIYLPEESFQNPALVYVTINQSTGDVTVTQQLGNE